jgi:molecular chaperone HtpG
MLYSHNVLIEEYSTELLPDWLSFVDGVIDSEDVSLNVSRETVQSNRIMRQLAKTIKGRVLRELKNLAKEDEEKYTKFWEQFGVAFKQGVATDFEAKKDLLPLFRFYSSKSDGRLTSLDAYLERMPESQETIYYVLGDNVKSVAHSPHLDPFKARDIEVLYWVDPLDSLVAPSLDEYQDKKFKNIDDAGLEFPEIEEEEAEESAEPLTPEANFNRFIGRCVTTLGDRVTEIRPSKVLKDSPVRLVSPEDAQNREMDRISRLLRENYEVPKRILEVNRNHPLIANLAQVAIDKPDSELVNLAIEQLYESALVQEGLHPNPAEMLPRIQKLMALAAANAAA